MTSRRSLHSLTTLRALALIASLAALAVQPARAQSEQVRAPSGTVFRSLADTSRIAAARAALARTPSDRARVLDLANAQVAAWQFREAIATYSAALEQSPADAILLRWRGHRYLALREFTRACDDLERASDLAPELYGAWFHLGLARSFLADFDGATDAFRKARSLAGSASERAASVDWLWSALTRSGRRDEADRMLSEPRESAASSDAYEKRIALYRGRQKPDDIVARADTASVVRSTLTHGVGQWLLIRGDTASARRWFERSLATGAWPSFGFIAAEVELARLSAR